MFVYYKERERSNPGGGGLPDRYVEIVALYVSLALYHNVVIVS
jgi:hypothetical protein